MKIHLLAAALTTFPLFAAPPAVDPQTLLAPGLVRQNNFEHGVPDFHHAQKILHRQTGLAGVPHNPAKLTKAEKELFKKYSVPHMGR